MITPDPQNSTSLNFSDFARDMHTVGNQGHRYITLHNQEASFQEISSLVAQALTSSISIDDKKNMLEGYKRVSEGFTSKHSSLLAKLFYCFHPRLEQETQRNIRIATEIIQHGQELIKSEIINSNNIAIQHYFSAIDDAISLFKKRGISGLNQKKWSTLLKDIKESLESYSKTITSLRKYPNNPTIKKIEKTYQKIQDAYSLLTLLLQLHALKETTDAVKMLRGETRENQARIVDQWVNHFDPPSDALLSILTNSFDKDLAARLRQDEIPVSIQEMDQITGALLKYTSPAQKKELKAVHQFLIKELRKQDPIKENAKIAEELDKTFQGEIIALAIHRPQDRKKRQEIGQLLRHPNLQKAREVASMLNATKEAEAISISAFAREPLENPEKKEGLIKPEEKFARFIAFERFQSALRGTFSQTLRDILLSPATERDYVILADEGHKSTNWVTTQVLDLMSVHPPKAIIPREKLKEYLISHPNVQHIVMIDDGAYSGEQAAKYIAQDLKGLLTDQKLHIAIPYMTSFAKERIQYALADGQVKRYHFPDGHIMLSYEDLEIVGFFGYTKMNRPDIKKLLEMPSLEIREDLDADQRKRVEGIQQKLNQLKQTVFQPPKSDISLDDHIRKQLSVLIEELNAEQRSIKNGESIGETLISIKNGVERFGVDLVKSKYAREDYVRSIGGEYDFKSRTGTWMAHKSADGMSTDIKTMRKAIKPQKWQSNPRAIEPYKSSAVIIRNREQQIKRLQNEFPTIVENWNKCTADLDLSQVQIVQSNRGLFLLGDNYTGKENLTPTTIEVIYSKEQTKIPLGGSNGAYQFQIEEGVPFTIQNGDKKGHFIYTKNEKGELELKRLQEDEYRKFLA